MMDYLDYRERLGIGFNDNDKAELFMNRISIMFDQHRNVSVDPEIERMFCYQIGEQCCLGLQDPLESLLGNQTSDLQRILEYFGRLTPDEYEEGVALRDFLVKLVALRNCSVGDNRLCGFIEECVETALRDTKICFEWAEGDDGDRFIFPVGASELDQALISESLEWLQEYPTSRAAFAKALEKYADDGASKPSEVADQFRKALETFFQDFLRPARAWKTARENTASI